MTRYPNDGQQNMTVVREALYAYDAARLSGDPFRAVPQLPLALLVQAERHRAAVLTRTEETT